MVNRLISSRLKGCFIADSSFDRRDRVHLNHCGPVYPGDDGSSRHAHEIEKADPIIS